jgi:hypothetical protein
MSGSIQLAEALHATTTQSSMARNPRTASAGGKAEQKWRNNTDRMKVLCKFDMPVELLARMLRSQLPAGLPAAAPHQPSATSPHSPFDTVVQSAQPDGCSRETNLLRSPMTPLARLDSRPLLCSTFHDFHAEPEHLRAAALQTLRKPGRHGTVAPPPPVKWGTGPASRATIRGGPPKPVPPTGI